jgi:hypothetical protein
MTDMNEQSPERIQADIERTREELRDDVEALQEKLSPSAAAKRGVNRVQESVQQVRETLMGSAEEGQVKAQAGVNRAAETLQEGVERTKGTVAEAGHRAKRTARGNPMAVGLAAFAVGWLVSSLLPASTRERETARSIKESEVTGNVAAPLVESARSVAQSAGEQAKEAAVEVGQKAKEAAATVAESAKGAAEETKATATSGAAV